MKFEWDDGKSDSNQKKHQIRFEEAQTVFLDSHAIEFYDQDNSENEDRFIRIGLSGKLNVLLVVDCDLAAQEIRIISARKATAQERNLYEKRI